MDIKERKMKGVFEIQMKPHLDERGFFMRTYDDKIFNQYGLDRNWVQENHARSIQKGILRGLHFQLFPHAETKLIRAIRGSVFDVFVDLRLSSSTFGQWDAIELTEDNFKMIYIPQGFAHGYCTLSDCAELIYKVDSYYHPESERGIVFSDKTLKIQWPIKNIITSGKDKKLPSFEDIKLVLKEQSCA